MNCFRTTLKSSEVFFSTNCFPFSPAVYFTKLLCFNNVFIYFLQLKKHLPAAQSTLQRPPPIHDDSMSSSEEERQNDIAEGRIAAALARRQMQSDGSQPQSQSQSQVAAGSSVVTPPGRGILNDTPAVVVPRRRRRPEAQRLDHAADQQLQGQAETQLQQSVALQQRVGDMLQNMSFMTTSVRRTFGNYATAEMENIHEDLWDEFKDRMYDLMKEFR